MGDGVQRQSSKAEVEALQAIGLEADELVVYETLLQYPGTRAVDIAASSKFSVRHVRHLLGQLERKSLVTRSLERVPSYRAVAPELAFGSLIAQRQSGLQAAQFLAKELARIQPSIHGAESDELTVELITGRDVLSRVIGKLYDSAQHEILEFSRPPFVNSLEQNEAIYAPLHARNVRCRSIVDITTFEWPGGAEIIRGCAMAGEEMRLFDGVPIKAALVDHRMALVPLHMKSGNESGLLLRPSLLLDALYAHFELIWQMAVPIGPDGILNAAPDGSECDELDQLLALLANGLKDKVIASRLKWSQRTFDRRLSSLQKQLRAHSRFQAGWNAAVRAMQKSR